MLILYFILNKYIYYKYIYCVRFLVNTDIDISLWDLLSISIDEKKNRQEYLRINRQAQEEYEELKTLIDLIMAWRCAQTAVSNLSNVYHCIFAKPEKH